MEGGRRSAAARCGIALLVLCGCGMGIAASVSSAQSAGGSAPGGPGTTAYMDVARKDCFLITRQLPDDSRRKLNILLAEDNPVNRVLCDVRE